MPDQFEQRRSELAGATTAITFDAANKLVTEGVTDSFSSHTKMTTGPLGVVSSTTDFKGSQQNQNMETLTTREDKPGTAVLNTAIRTADGRPTGSLQTEISTVFGLGDASTAETRMTSTRRNANGDVIGTTDYVLPLDAKESQVTMKDGAGKVIATGKATDTQLDGQTSLHVESLWNPQGKYIGQVSEKIHLDPSTQQATVDTTVSRDAKKK
jgi:hypothetical protein